MQERAPIARLVFTQLGRIDEEAVAGRKQEPNTEAFGRQAKRLQVLHHDGRFRVLGAEILAEFVAEIGGGIVPVPG